MTAGLTSLWADRCPSSATVAKSAQWAGGGSKHEIERVRESEKRRKEVRKKTLVVLLDSASGEMMPSGYLLCFLSGSVP